MSILLRTFFLILCRFNFEMYLMSCEEHSALFKKEPAGRQGRTVAG